MDKKELEKDFIQRWGNAQKCSHCDFTLPYGQFDKLQTCCGEEMKPVK